MLDLQEQYDKIYRYCYFKLYDRNLAEDITQETFLKYYEHYSFNNENTALKHLYTIARNLCIDEFRRTKTESIDESTVELPYENDVTDKLAIKNAIRRLNDDEKELLLLRYVNELNVGSIGEMLGISRFATMRKIKVAVKRFKEELRKEDMHE
ncbi:MAG: RNA polymerase sigma factor [Lachnospiraceae bacterium]|nr:RNA polymerase sigma factor [Lachnospiraceae bacterium]